MTVIAAFDAGFGIEGTISAGCRAVKNGLLIIAELERRWPFVAKGVVVGGRLVAQIVVEESWTSYFRTDFGAMQGRRSVVLGLATAATFAGELVVE